MSLGQPSPTRATTAVRPGGTPDVVAVREPAAPVLVRLATGAVLLLVALLAHDGGHGGLLLVALAGGVLVPTSLLLRLARRRGRPGFGVSEVGLHDTAGRPGGVVPWDDVVALVWRGAGLLDLLHRRGWPVRPPDTTTVRLVALTPDAAVRVTARVGGHRFVARVEDELHASGVVPPALLGDLPAARGRTAPELPRPDAGSHRVVLPRFQPLLLGLMTLVAGGVPLLLATGRGPTDPLPGLVAPASAVLVLVLVWPLLGAVGSAVVVDASGVHGVPGRAEVLRWEDVTALRWRPSLRAADDGPTGARTFLELVADCDEGEVLLFDAEGRLSDARPVEAQLRRSGVVPARLQPLLRGCWPVAPHRD